MFCIICSNKLNVLSFFSKEKSNIRFVNFYQFTLKKPKQSDKKVSNIVYYQCESSIGFPYFGFFIIQKKTIKLVLIIEIRSVWFLSKTQQTTTTKNKYNHTQKGWFSFSYHSIILRLDFFSLLIVVTVVFLYVLAFFFFYEDLWGRE
jgi:hypothetical protein